MKALLNIQQELKAPKNQKNSFGNYNYRSAEDILEAVKPLLKKNNAVLIISDKPVLVGDWVFIEAKATLKSEEGEISVKAYARHSTDKKGMDDSQISGSTSSYARKYALNGLFAIDDTKDSDATNTHGNAQAVASDKENQKVLTHIAMSKDIETLEKVKPHLATAQQKFMYSKKLKELEG